MEESRCKDPALPLWIEKGDSNRVSLQSGDYQLLYLLDGIVYCKSKEGFTELKPVGVIIIPPGSGIRIRMTEKNNFYRVFLAPWFFSEYRTRYWEQDFLFFFKDRTTFFSLSEDVQEIIRRILDELIIETGLKKPGYRELCRIKLSELFIILARIKTKDNLKIDISVTARGIRDIIHYLEEHYTETITLEQVADFAGYSPSYLSRYFKKSTGICLFAYVNKIRVQKACTLLKRMDKTILEIAYAVGYNNISFFNRCFRKIMNMSPLEFRRGF